MGEVQSAWAAVRQAPAGDGEAPQRALLQGDDRDIEGAIPEPPWSSNLVSRFRVLSERNLKQPNARSRLGQVIQYGWFILVSFSNALSFSASPQLF